MRFVPKGPKRTKMFYLKIQLFSTPQQKEFLKYINSKESNASRKSFESIEVQSCVYHKEVPSIVCDLPRK